MLNTLNTRRVYRFILNALLVTTQGIQPLRSMMRLPRYASSRRRSPWNIVNGLRILGYFTWAALLFWLAHDHHYGNAQVRRYK